MKHIILLVATSFSLTGCIGAILSGQTELNDEDYPDITTVPCRAEAQSDWGAHGGSEVVARQQSQNALQKNREALRQQNEELRSRYF
jgi:hypothetical protein